MLFDIGGKTAVVTGGAKGVGAMISRSLVAAGVRVLVAARDGPENRAFAASLGDADRCLLIPCDLSTEEGVLAAAGAIQEQADAVHILVNNAGTFTAATVDAITPAQWDREFAVNLRAPFFLVQALLPQLKAAARRPTISRSTTSVAAIPQDGTRPTSVAAPSRRRCTGSGRTARVRSRRRADFARPPICSTNAMSWWMKEARPLSAFAGSMRYRIREAKADNQLAADVVRAGYGIDAAA